MVDVARFKQRLLDELAELANEGTHDEATKPVELDQQSIGRVSRIDAIQQQQMAQATERRRQIQMQRIKAALKRVDEDEYGYCAECGDEILEKRLDTDPAIPTCTKCAAAHETS